jgi:hypothetical protein
MTLLQEAAVPSIPSINWNWASTAWKWNNVFQYWSMSLVDEQVAWFRCLLLPPIWTMLRTYDNKRCLRAITGRFRGFRKMARVASISTYAYTKIDWELINSWLSGCLTLKLFKGTPYSFASFLCLFHDAISTSDDWTPIGRIFTGWWLEATVAYCEVLCRHSPGGTGDNPPKTSVRSVGITASGNLLGHFPFHTTLITQNNFDSNTRHRASIIFNDKNRTLSGQIM